MSRSARRTALAGIALGGFGLLGYELWPRDETRIAQRLNDLCAQLNETRDLGSLGRLRQGLGEALLEQANLRVAELDLDVQGSAEIAHRASELLSSGVPLSFSLSGLEVHVSGQLARADFDLLVLPRGSGEQRRELRHTRVRLGKRGADWRIEAVEVDRIADSEPEARP